MSLDSMNMTMIDDFFPFDGQQRMGASAVFAFSLLSSIALVLVFFRIFWICVVAMARRTSVENVASEGFFLKSQLGQFAGCLLLSNFFTSISGIIGINWVALNGVQHGTTCNAQGALGQIGEFATAYFILAMGIHTFNTLVLRSNHATSFVIFSIVFGWVAALLIGSVPAAIYSPSLGPLYGFVTIDCDITRAYPAAHAVVYFLPLFLSLFTSTTIYALIYLVLRGNVTINGGLKFHMVPQSQSWRTRDKNVEQYKRFVRAVARSMIWFPVVFAICVVPNAIVQLLDTSGYRTTTPGTTFTLVLRHMNGVFDVLIFYNVLRILGPVFTGRSSVTEKNAMRGDVPPESAVRPGVGRSFMDDENPLRQKPFAPIPTPGGRQPWQTHRHGGSAGSSAANSTTLLLPSDASSIMQSDAGHVRNPGSDVGHPRTVTKSMISKPRPVDADADATLAESTNTIQTRLIPARGSSLTAETAQRRTDSVDALNDFFASYMPNERSDSLSQEARKPLPLLPERLRTILTATERDSYAAEASISAPERTDSIDTSARPTALPSSAHFPSSPIAAPVASAPSLATISTDTDATESIDYTRKRKGSENEIVVQPFSPIGPHRRNTGRATAVISMYMSSRRSSHEDTLPDFPTTASEFPVAQLPPRPPGEPRDFINPAPPPRVLRRSPSPPAPLSRPIVHATRVPSPRPPPPLPQDAVPATAVMTEFDVNEYLRSPVPPVPAMPALPQAKITNVAAKTITEPRRPPPSPARTELDMLDYYGDEARDEVPGLPPLPNFRTRLTVYDDELSIYSASTAVTGFGFGVRPRDSHLLSRKQPLPEHMRLDVNVSPVALTVPTPKIPSTRGFRPIL